MTQCGPCPLSQIIFNYSCAPCPSASIQYFVCSCRCNVLFYAYDSIHNVCAVDATQTVLITLSGASFLISLFVFLYSLKVGLRLRKNYGNDSSLYLTASLLGACMFSIIDLFYFSSIKMYFTMFYFLALAILQISVIVEVAQLNFKFGGLSLFFMPLKKYFNPNKTKKYWIKLEIIYPCIVFVIGIIAELITTVIGQNNIQVASLIFYIIILLSCACCLWFSYYLIKNAMAHRKFLERQLQSNIGKLQLMSAWLNAALFIGIAVCTILFCAIAIFYFIGGKAHQDMDIMMLGQYIREYYVIAAIILFVVVQFFIAKDTEKTMLQIDLEKVNNKISNYCDEDYKELDGKEDAVETLQ